MLSFATVSGSFDQAGFDVLTSCPPTQLDVFALQDDKLWPVDLNVILQNLNKAGVQHCGGHSMEVCGAGLVQYGCTDPSVNRAMYSQLNATVIIGFGSFRNEFRKGLDRFRTWVAHV